MRGNYATAESREWRRARHAAFVQDVLTAFTQRPAGLMSFEDVHQKLQLANLHYLDVQEVPLDQIVGSVGRYTDFTRAFFPRQDHLQARWQRIEELVATGRDLPPIELYHRNHPPARGPRVFPRPHGDGSLPLAMPESAGTRSKLRPSDLGPRGGP